MSARPPNNRKEGNPLRFISKYAKYKMPGVHEKVERMADGSMRQKAPGYMVEFRQGDLTNYERDFARKVFVWKGLPTALGGSKELDPLDDLHRVSSFDTSWVPEEFRERVEANLLANTALGQDYVLVEQPVLVAPWPSYDKLTAQGRRTVEMVAEKIAAQVTENGYDVGQVLAYERQTLNRPEVVAALEALSVAPTDDELVAA